MGQRYNFRRHVCLLLLCIVCGVKGQENSSSESEEGHHRSMVKIPTCCAIDLNLANSTCKDSKNGVKLKEWTFPWNMMAENVSTTFSLQVKRVKCLSDPAMTVSLSIIHVEGYPYKLLRNGYLKVAKEYYPPGEYCINAVSETDMEVQVCPQKCDGTRPCIRKCCGLDKVYSFGRDKALPQGCQSPKEGHSDYWKPEFYDSYQTKSIKSIPAPHFIELYPSTFKYSCPRNKTLFYLFPENAAILSESFKRTFNGLVYRIREDGKILFKHQKDGRCVEVEPKNVCIDGVVNYGNGNLTYVNHEEEMVLFQCILPPPENTDVKKAVGMLYGVIMLASSVFLLLTIATYVALWDRQSVHGWTIVSHTVSLFFMYIFLGVAHIIGVTSGHDFLGTASCIGIGITTHYFFLSTFCWLFLISVDLWLTFRAFTPRSGTRSKGVSRYIKYSIFGWGVPAVIVIVGIILEDRYPDEDCHTLITPAYGKDSCFPQQKSLGVYLYYPVAVMIALNLVFFLITTFKLYLYRESTKMATKDDNKTQLYGLFVKLFFIMGILWVFEVISWAVSGTGYNSFWVLFDLLNVLRALAVFIIFVCKRDIIFSLEEKYPCLKPVLLPFTWCFKQNPSSHGGRDHDSSMTRTSTLRHTITTEVKPPESIGLIVSSNKP